MRGLFDDLPAVPPPAERLDTILSGPGLRLERIVSLGHVTPPGEWYDQDADEWVLVVRGRARLRFEDGADALGLEAGDHLFIPAHRRHRVEWTDPDRPTVWLALHLAPGAAAPPGGIAP